MDLLYDSKSCICVSPYTFIFLYIVLLYIIYCLSNLKLLDNNLVNVYTRICNPNSAYGRCGFHEEGAIWRRGIGRKCEKIFLTT